MSNQYIIYTDASADVDVDFLKENNVKFVRMNYMIGEEEISCDSIESPETMKKFYDAQRAGKETRTSQITPNTYMETFAPELEAGNSVLYLCLSSGLTKTFDSVTLASQMLAEDYTDAKVVPFDTLAATAGMGLIIERAVENQKKGMSIEENVADLEEIRKHVALWFTVDDLMFLKRGGRISSASAVVGTALNVKPIIKVDDEGKLETVEKKRGVKAAIKTLVKRYKDTHDATLGKHVYVVHGDDLEKANQVEAAISEIDPDAYFTKMHVCPVIGSHVGPGMVAAVFYATER